MEAEILMTPCRALMTQHAIHPQRSMKNQFIPCKYVVLLHVKTKSNILHKTVPEVMLITRPSSNFVRLSHDLQYTD
jgi:hypothetical protein